MAIIKQIDANKNFSVRVQDKFKAWCKKKGKVTSTDNFVKFLVRHNFINKTIINRFLSVDLFEEELPKTANKLNPKGRKQVTVWNIEDKIPLGETWIKSNINNHKYYFRDRPSRFH
jgi:hypothetical protein